MRGDGGAALAELALILPFLITLVFGAVDAARVWQVKNRLANAAREGAHAVMHHPGSIRSGCNGQVNVEDRVRAEDPSLAIGSVAVRKERDADGDGTAGTVPRSQCGPYSAIESGDRVSVTVSANFTWYAPIFALVFGDDTSTISGRSEVVVQ